MGEPFGVTVASIVAVVLVTFETTVAPAAGGIVRRPMFPCVPALSASHIAPSGPAVIPSGSALAAMPVKVLRDLAVDGDAADRGGAGALREPQRAVTAGRDSLRPAGRRQTGEVLGDDAAGGDSSDSARPTRLGEPERPIGPDGDVPRRPTRRDSRAELGDHAGRRDAADLVGCRSVNQRLPSGPATIAFGSELVVKPAVNPTTPEPFVAMRPIAPPFFCSVNQIRPSGPAVMPDGLSLCETVELDRHACRRQSQQLIPAVLGDPQVAVGSLTIPAGSESLLKPDSWPPTNSVTAPAVVIFSTRPGSP